MWFHRLILRFKIKLHLVIMAYQDTPTTISLVKKLEASDQFNNITVYDKSAVRTLFSSYTL